MLELRIMLVPITKIASFSVTYYQRVIHLFYIITTDIALDRDMSFIIYS